MSASCPIHPLHVTLHDGSIISCILWPLLTLAFLTELAGNRRSLRHLHTGQGKETLSVADMARKYNTR